MAILIDQIVTHGTSGAGNDTVPPGIDTGTYGLAWCHLVSDTDLAELEGFLTNNPQIGQPPENIRQPILGSMMTYAGLDTDMRDQAIAAGAAPNRVPTVASRCFDSQGPLYEP